MNAEPLHAVPRKRVFAPGPRMDATRLFERPGPMLTVCMHPQKGFLIGDRDGTPVWSHADDLVLHEAANHPDVFRTAATWPDDKNAYDDLVKILSRSEFNVVSFLTLRADVAESPNTTGFAQVDAAPRALISLEACHEATRRFPPTDRHRLDSQMRRIKKVKVAPISLGMAGRQVEDA